MSLVTFEVEIDHGRVVARGSEPLPEKGRGLLTLLPDSASLPARGSVSEFIGRWTGSFSLPESPVDDPRLAFLLAKHAK
jgi:hypothetical protein